MAQPVTCDICQSELAVQMLSNLESGEVIAMGPACLPVFYGQSVLAVTGAGEHKGLPQKCQACRRVHERMTLATAAAAPDHGEGPGNVRDQPGPPIDRDKCPVCKAGVLVPELGMCRDCAADHDQAADVEHEETGLFHGSGEEAL